MNTTAKTADKPLTVEELAAHWGVSKKAIYNMRYRGKAPRCFKRGRNLMFPIAEIEAFEQAGMEEHSTAA